MKSVLFNQERLMSGIKAVPVPWPPKDLGKCDDSRKNYDVLQQHEPGWLL